MNENKNEIAKINIERHDVDICRRPNREILWFQKLIKQEQCNYIVDKTLAKRILNCILRRMKNE